MKVLAFADVHAGKANLAKILKQAKDADLLISAGDLSAFQDGFRESLALLLKAKKKILIIQGNLPHEDLRMVRDAARLSPLIIPLHKHILEFGDVSFVGFGGGGFARFEPDMAKFFAQARHLLMGKKKIVFVTHAPPYNTTTDYLYWLGEHVGCQTTVDVIKKIKPFITVCGHLHETALLEDTIGSTRVVNVGSEGFLFEI